MAAQTTERTRVLELGDLGFSTMPAGLTGAEIIAYHKGYDRSARAYMKKNGGPGVVHDGAAPAAGTAERRALAEQLAEQGRAYRVASHPKCHAGGMSAVRAYLRKIGAETRPAEIVDLCAPAKAARKPRKLAAVPDVAPEEAAAAVIERHALDETHNATTANGEPVGVETVDDDRPANRTRKAARRELAAAMRERGEDPSDPTAWATAKTAAGIR